MRNNLLEELRDKTLYYFVYSTISIITKEYISSTSTFLLFKTVGKLLKLWIVVNFFPRESFNTKRNRPYFVHT